MSRDTKKRLKKRHRFLTIKNKMFYYTFAIIFLMSLLSVYSLTITNVYKAKIDEMFVRNIDLKEIHDRLDVIDAELVSYLSTKSSTSLNNFMLNEEQLRDTINKTVDRVSGYSEEELMVLDINSMTRNYLIIANQAIQDKRKSNQSALLKKYESAALIKSYIEDYVNELNIRQLDRNATNYIQMTKLVQTSNILNIVLIIVLILLSTIMVLSMTKSMIDPIISLSHSAGDIARGEFETEEIIVETNDEIELLARAFNKMKKSIYDYIEALKEKAFTEAKLKDQQMENLKMQSLLDNARLYALQSQMNPHFLFNTINAAVQMSMIEGADRTSEFLETMSRLFRYNIRQLDEAVSLNQEVENINDYYELLKVRFGDLIGCTFDVDESALEVMIPPLTLQPIVENAYIHGLSKREEGGHINVTVSTHQSHVSVIIEDNGIGMSGERVDFIYQSVNHEHRPEKTKSSNGIGMANVIERLELFYKQEDLLEIQSEEGQGTKVIVTIPFDGGRSHD